MTDIPGATSSTYTLSSADLGMLVTVKVTATNTAGSANATAVAVGPITAASGGTSKVLLSDGTSALLQTDSTSKVTKAGP